MVDVGAIFQAIGNTLGGVAGYFLSQQDRDAQAKLIKKASDEFGNVNLPQLKQLVAEQIRADPKYAQMTQGADSALKDVADSGGLTLSDKAALNQVRAKQSLSESAGRGQIAQQMSERGQLGSGAQLSMQLANQQNSATNVNAASEATSGQAQARALQAIKDRANLGMQANAQDQSMQKFNAGERTDASKYNNGLLETSYNQQMGIAARKAAADQQMAQWHAQQAAMIGGTVNQGLSGGGEAAAGIYNMTGNTNKAQSQTQANSDAQYDEYGKPRSSGIWGNENPKD